IHPEWVAIRLVDLSGRTLLDTRFSLGDSMPPILDRSSFDNLLRTRAPVVGNLTRDEHGEWLFSVRAPIVRDGQLRYVLSALVRPVTIRDLLLRQRAPSDWVISIVDANG